MLVATLSKRLLRVGQAKRCGLSLRSFSDAKDKDLVLTSIDGDTGVATITMNQAPVNSLSLEMCQAITTAIKEVESQPEIQSLVLASSLPGVFCAGLDITELHKPDEKRLTDFWHSFQQIYFDLYGSRLATIAAIAGHAPAAGCMLALSCDYRIMVSGAGSKKPSTIGLNETKLGIVAPSWLGYQYIDTIGQRQAELGLSLGLLHQPEQALAIGLVDELVPREEVLSRAQAEAVKWGKIPAKARLASKMLARKARLDHLAATRKEDNDFFRSFVTNETAQKIIDGYLQSLSKKKS
ncbi:CoA delta isomerase 1, mitochondrial [Seminavis robusta]|uniref:Enoyl-CoA delta isomerase 1, mitochondrial n=1 Tax=Seminavis robusta TaxID=568900 RepID=A0A9N8E4E0_9STRA|nr:CoA delta isomerase 1, mitochondrial [Seminavis robusta]|eukprot:Sro637_g179490.1 CoA delta isomerase 1, mitochondrial (295) ;mRNA; r:53523-54490